MGLVVLEGMQFYAYHGYYEEERLIGNDYTVDVYIEVDYEEAAATDELGGTLNYETIYRIAKIEMSKPSKLIESIAAQIIDATVLISNQVQAMRVRITKKNPPLGARISRAFIEIEEDFVEECHKCGRPFLVHDPEEVWTNHGIVYPETRATLTRIYGPYICEQCLKPHLLKQ